MLISALASSILCATLAAEPIKLGIQAPPLENVTWIKGEPINQWAAGHVYLLDFWAPWCQPCIRLMPHNAELAKKHEGALTVVAVAVWPQPGSEDPSAYVERAGDDMPFTVADDVNGHINETWLSPLGVEGIPHVVLIDKQGRIAWSGHPMSGMDEALTSILDGTYDTDAAANKANAEAELRAAAEPIMQQASALAAQGQWEQALTKVDELIAMGFQPLEMTLTRFHVMLTQLHDEPGAYAYLDKAAAGPLKDDAESLTQIAWFVANAPELPGRDLDLAQRIAERANTINDSKDPVTLFTLGSIAAARNHREDAIARYEQAIALASGDMKTQMQESLDDYRARSADPGPSPEPAPAPAAPEPAPR